MSVFTDELIQKFIDIVEPKPKLAQSLPATNWVEQTGPDNSDLFNLDNSDLVDLEKPTGQAPAQPTGHASEQPYRSPQQAASVMQNPTVVSMQDAIIELVDLLETEAVQKSKALGVLMTEETKKLIEQMRHLGRSAGRGDETKADGLWEGKTNRSLGYAAQIGNAVLGLATRYKVDTGAFNYQELNSFQVSIPKDLKTADKPKLAVVMEKYIREIIDMIKRFNADPNANQAAGTTNTGQPGQNQNPGQQTPGQQAPGQTGQQSGETSQQGQGQTGTSSQTPAQSMAKAIVSAVGTPIGDPLYLDRLQQFFVLISGWAQKNIDQFSRNLGAIYHTAPDSQAVQTKLSEINKTVQTGINMLDQIRGTWIMKTTIGSAEIKTSGQNPATLWMKGFMRPGMQDVDGQHCADMIVQALSLALSLIQSIAPETEFATEQAQIASQWTERFNQISTLLR